MGGITLRLALVGLVGSARGFELSEPLAGLACDSDADGESLELGHRQLDVSTPNWLQAGKELCAEECEQIAGCTTFHVMQSNGCIDEVGPDVCVPWAECTFFSRCEALEKSDEDWMDYSTSTAYFLTDRAAAPAVPSTGDRRQMYAGQNGEEVCENKGYNPTQCAAIGCCQFDPSTGENGECWSAVGAGSCSGGGAAMSSMAITMDGLSMPVTMPPGYTMTSMSNVFHGNSLADVVMPPVIPPMTPQTPAPEEGSGTMPPPLPDSPPSPASPPPPPPSPTAPQPPFSPQPAGTTFEEKPAKQFTITVKFAGTIDTFDKVNYEKGIRKLLACQEPTCKVAIAVTAASVNVETTVTDTSTDTANNAVAKAAELKALTKEQLQTAIAAEVPGVVVESTADVSDPIDTTLIVAVPASPSSPPPASPLAPPPTDQTGVEDSDSKQSTNEALGAGLGLGLGLPVLCMFLFCIHVQLSFPAEMRGKYLKWRFSHTNPRCCGFMPKDRRDALWAEIKGNSSNRVSDRETAVEIPKPGAKAEDKKEVI